MAIKIESPDGFQTPSGAQINETVVYADAMSRQDWGLLKTFPMRFRAVLAIDGENAYKALDAQIAGVDKESVTIQELAELVGPGFNIEDINLKNIQQVVANRWAALYPDKTFTVEFTPLN